MNGKTTRRTHHGQCSFAGGRGALRRRLLGLRGAGFRVRSHEAHCIPDFREVLRLANLERLGSDLAPQVF
jgi:hypothetical protein